MTVPVGPWVGDGVVHRTAGPWSPAVQQLLGYLRDAGFAYSPRPLGVDRDGNERVEYIEGDHGAACWSRIAAPSGIERFGRLLREFHDAVAGFEPSPGSTWKLPALAAHDALVCHGDFAPWNIVWRGDDPVGIIDWEFARPRSRLDDVAWAAIWSVPLRSDEEAVDGWDCWPSPPDRRRRLELFLRGYGPSDAVEVVDRAIDVLTQTYHDVVALALQGLEPQRTWVDDGTANVDLERAAWIEQNRRTILG